ncbi:MAG: threonylcarbamoyl-AMP synthase [Rhodobacteraceae bacterium]|nr:threonylcarbamoyl-AMP synthase [Paracoccaceae bacterium]
MPEDQPETLLPDDNGLARAAVLLGQGHVLALPTETVYGLAADARSDMACARVFRAKGRPRFNPLIVHLQDIAGAEALAEVCSTARDLARAFWPGPLTLVLPLKAGHGLSPLATAGLDTVAIRVPSHPVARAVLALFGGPVVAPSANPFGRVSPTTADHVRQGLGGAPAAILDAGPCAVGLESTILAPGLSGIRLLREGGLPSEVVEAMTGPLIPDTAPGTVQAPGQLAGHYAPAVPVVMDSDLSEHAAVRIGFTADQAADLHLSQSGNLAEAAARLFDVLHRAESLALARNEPAIHVAPVPKTGLGRAINDRLRRAAAMRH